MTEQELQERAEANVGFYRHLMVYVLVNLGLLGLDYMDNGSINWALFPLLGWGIGLLSHYVQIQSFGFFSVEKEKERLRKKQRN